jgi:hypothetical protein
LRDRQTVYIRRSSDPLAYLSQYPAAHKDNDECEKGKRKKKQPRHPIAPSGIYDPLHEKNSGETGNGDESHDLAEHDVSWTGSGHDFTIA